jgi:hypothetical protein
VAAEIETYLDALATFKAASARLVQLGTEIADVGEYMRKHPGSIGFANLGPINTMSGRIVKTVDGAKWPSAQDLQNAVNHYHASHATMMNAYQQVPAPRRGMIEQPPPSPPTR